MADRSPLSLSVLGPLEVMVHGAPAQLGGPQQRRVLAVLAVNANKVVSSDRLIDVLWGDAPPASASHTLQALVSRLRSGLGADRVETVSPGYRLHVNSAEVDVQRFEELVRAGLASVERPEAAAAAFGEALALWRGRPYAEFAEEEFARAEVARIGELRLCAVEEHARALVELGRPGEVIAALEVETAIEPFRERLRYVLMLALARAGRPVEALRVFDAYRRLLADEVGVVPSPVLQELNDDILRQHPDLDWERPADVGATFGELPNGTVTFLFTDLEGSTRMWQEHPDAMSGALARHDAIVRDAIELQSGWVVKTTGDGFHAVFANADDAIDAAVAAQLGLQTEPWGDVGSVRVRMGVHTGSAEQRDGDYYGSPVNQAARLMGIAHGGQIVCSGVVAELVGDDVELADLGAHRLRDFESALRVFQVVAPALESRFPPLRSLDAYRSNLPHDLSTMVGRVDDIASVVKALAENRVVSIIGMGGVGKTRLALRIGSSSLSAYADGVWWCELAGLRDPDAVPEAVAAALGYSPSQGASLAEGLASFFRHKQLLLILDNCEHLLSAVAGFVSAMGEEAPRLSILSTSREALAIHGEQIYPLAPLDLPADRSPFEVEESEAGALFAARARDARPTFAVNSENAAAIADLCAQLEGNALAIELAAARTTMMSPSEILARLDQRLRFLTGGSRDATDRHQTLQAAIDWSYALLDPTEQELLLRLSVFVGDFDLAAATAIAEDAGLDEFDAVDRLGSLVAKSLVEHSDTTSGSRYRLLETIRQYATARLQAEGNTRRARDAHASHYLTTSLDLFAMLTTVRDFDALESLEVDTPNLVVGLRWLLDSNRFAEVLAFFADAGWVDVGLLPFVLLDELGRIADQALEHEGASAAHGYVDALFYAGIRAFVVGDWERYQFVTSVGSEADPHSPSMLSLGPGAATMRGDFASAMSMARKAVQRARQVDNDGFVAFTLGLLALGQLATDPVQALADAADAVDAARRSPAKSALIYPLFVLSLAAQRSDPDRALAAAEECIRLDRTHRKAWSTNCAALTAKLQVDRGELADGLLLWRDLLHHLHWAGELGPLSLSLPALADSIAGIDSTLALELTVVSESGVIAPFPAFDVLGQYERLAETFDELGPDALRAARSRAASMTYDDAIQYVFDGIDRLIAETSNDQRRAARPNRSA